MKFILPPGIISLDAEFNTYCELILLWMTWFTFFKGISRFKLVATGGPPVPADGICTVS